MAPPRVPDTTTRRVPKREAANSTLPMPEARRCSRDADHEEIAQALVEDDLGGHARVGAAEE